MHDYYQDRAVQDALNGAWRAQCMDRSQVRWLPGQGEDTMAELPGGPHPLTPEQVQRVLARAKGEGDNAPPVTPVLPVVEQQTVGATKRGEPTATRNIGTVARMLIINGKSNAEVFAALQQEFQLPNSRRSYPAWYRAQLTKEGVLTGTANATTTTRSTTMAAPALRMNTGSLADQVKAYADLCTSLSTQIKALTDGQKGLLAAHEAYCQSMGYKTAEEQAQSPIHAQLSGAQDKVKAMETQLKEAQRQQHALTQALAAYNKSLGVKEEGAPEAPPAPPQAPMNGADRVIRMGADLPRQQAKRAGRR